MPHFEYCIDCGGKFNNLELNSHFFRCRSCQEKHRRKWQREQDEMVGYRIRQKREQRRKMLTIILKPTKIFGFCNKIYEVFYKIIRCVFCVIVSTYLITAPFKPELKMFHLFATISLCLFSIDYITENIGELLKWIKTGGTRK